jgi:hypothetical protein
LRDTRRTAQARRNLEDMLAASRPQPAPQQRAAGRRDGGHPDQRQPGGDGHRRRVAPLLQELEAGTQRAAALYAQLRRFSA